MKLLMVSTQKCSSAKENKSNTSEAQEQHQQSNTSNMGNTQEQHELARSNFDVVAPKKGRCQANK